MTTTWLFLIFKYLHCKIIKNNGLETRLGCTVRINAMLDFFNFCKGKNKLYFFKKKVKKIYKKVEIYK